MPSTPTRRSLLLSSLAWGAVGCGSVRHFPFDRGVGQQLVGDAEALQIQYFSTGCLLLQWRTTAVLSDPFWSHLSLGRVAFGRLASDPRQLEPHVPALDRVQAVVVGHGHYDHVLDLPAICDRLHPEAAILASASVGHQYAAVELPRPIQPVDDWLAGPDRPGRWWGSADGRMRILPVASGHPAQYAGIHLFPRTLTEDATRPPTRARHFQEGPTLAFLVDFLDGGEIAHRVYLQTSSRGLPDGALPEAVRAERPVDVAVLAMDCARAAARGESVIDHLDPHTVIFCHWENFFRPKDRPPREIVKVDLDRLRAALPSTEERRYLFPAWDAVFRFPDD